MAFVLRHGRPRVMGPARSRLEVALIARQDEFGFAQGQVPEFP